MLRAWSSCSGPWGVSQRASHAPRLLLMRRCWRAKGEMHDPKITLSQAGVVHPTPWVGVARSLVRGVSQVLQLLGYG